MRVPYSAQQMYDLVSDVEAYPHFLPWCRSARVFGTSGDRATAEIELALGGIHKSFTTRNRAVPGERIDIHLANGPFRRLEGAWRFRDLPEGGCEVSLDMDFEFASRMLSMALSGAFGQVTRTLVDAFRRRAVQMYGSG
ncbi:MAG TPA: type II toxin-antitoxin system RatA family toxin [Gammaproteobacteria bacterium]|nr:type II toxin-antitoxin system RatA family toxin [Gammaproteobacteria bacterium]